MNSALKDHVPASPHTAHSRCSKVAGWLQCKMAMFHATLPQLCSNNSMSASCNVSGSRAKNINNGTCVCDGRDDIECVQNHR